MERKLFDFAFENKIPLIGVCRGMQMMNVVSGGTLYGDLPTEIGTKVIHRNMFLWITLVPISVGKSPYNVPPLTTFIICMPLQTPIRGILFSKAKSNNLRSKVSLL